VIEFILCIPAIPFWMALSAGLPADWSVIQTYFAITVILSLRRWCGIARVVRGRFLQLREEDFVMAAKVAGASESRIMFKHMVPAFMSYIIVRATIMIPGMIIAETALSFLGLGIRPPAVSWGSLLQATQSAQVVIMHPWILIPGVFVIIAVLAFNFVGDGLRDAADPYKQ
jgi:peptide/nickel transport system permease protein